MTTATSLRARTLRTRIDTDAPCPACGGDALVVERCGADGWQESARSCLRRCEDVASVVLPEAAGS